MIRNWLEAIGDDATPLLRPSTRTVAPPAMAQVWTMPGLHGDRRDDDPLGAMMAVLDEAGFTSVVATNCEQTYHRYLRQARTVEVTHAAGGRGRPEEDRARRGLVRDDPQHLVRRRRAGGGDAVPGAEVPARARGRRRRGRAIRPVVNRDTEFFWEGTARGELRIQRCGGCGALRHPPGPMCPALRGDEAGVRGRGGRGEVYSYVVHHHPPVPGPDAAVRGRAGGAGRKACGCSASWWTSPPDEVRIGLPVRVGVRAGRRRR